MKHISLFVCALVGLVNMTRAQEVLVPLSGRSELMQLRKGYNYNKSVAAVDTLDLPFFDDFSEDFNKKFDDYYWPNTSRWVDRAAFINANLAIDPMSVGVATLDGVDYLGQPYNWFASNSGAAADTLTSVALNLSNTTDSTILSFYFQAGGLSTYQPETEDRLLVEFLDVDTNWVEVWTTPGDTADGLFHLVMLPIADTNYLYNGFQFRFRNYASLHTNGDFWHIDYVKLDDQRSINDTLTNDIALLTVGHSLLAEYSSMPWTHYKEYPDPAELMGSDFYFRVRNGLDTNKKVVREFEVTNSLGGVAFGSNTVNAATIDPLTACGNEFNECNSGFDNYTSDFNATYPTDVESSSDSAYFVVRNILVDTASTFPINDTTVYIQKFYNYYAYDDGTAEVAYGLGLLSEPASIAVRYDIKKQDSLQALQIYFDPVKWDQSNETFEIEIWSGDLVPEDLIYRSEPISPEYTVQNVFYHFLIDSIELSEGPVFIGWRQQANDNEIFTVGYDLNNDNSANRFYNLGTDWIQSSIPGSVMIRPVFGDTYEYDPITVEEFKPIEIGLFPNPVSDVLHIRTMESLENMTIEILDLTGRSIRKIPATVTVSVSNLMNGMYILRLKDPQTNTTITRRFIKQ